MASKTIYDYPLYYDILFGWDRSKEADFYLAGAEEPAITTGESWEMTRGGVTVRAVQAAAIRT